MDKYVIGVMILSGSLLIGGMLTNKIYKLRADEEEYNLTEDEYYIEDPE